ncbi:MULTISPECIES: hypothetical protein [unclassified Psychrobacillus]
MKKRKTIGTLGWGRTEWTISPVTKVKKNLKGKGSYTRKNAKYK